MERFGGVAELAPNLRIAGSVRPEGCGLALGFGMLEATTGG